MTYETLFGPACQTSSHARIETPWGPSVQVHRLLVKVFTQACLDASQCAWKPLRVDGYNCRQVRDSNAWSKHAYATAWDFFVTPPNVPPPGGVWTPDNAVTPEFAACFTRRGFTWGDTFSRKDTPHIEWDEARLPTLEEERPSQPVPSTPKEEPMPRFSFAKTDTSNAVHLLDREEFTRRVVPDLETWKNLARIYEIAEAYELVTDKALNFFDAKGNH